jgi:putative acetyltransferase
MIEIRAEQPGDIAVVREINERAFGRPLEAQIVDRLRENCPELISRVAVLDDRLVGHILFSPVVLESRAGVIHGMGLAPMAVLPAHQHQGIGSRLVHGGLAALRETGCPFVIVLGHPDYYPRFGFKPASQYGLRCQWDGVPDSAFMALVLDEGRLCGASGVVRYRHEFDEAV